MYYDDNTQPVEYVYAESDTPTRPGPTAQPPKKRKRGGCLRNIFVLSLLGLGLTVFAGVIATVTVLYLQFSSEIETGIEKLEAAPERETFQTTRIYDRNGELLWEIFGEGKRTNVPLTGIPEALQNATIAVEDDTFYDNVGADVPSLIAALIANYRNPDERPRGASTITQQLVRHIAFEYEERTDISYNRKAKEIVLAWIMTRDYEKEKILEMYLNEIYYGNLAYGVEAASQTYFGKSANDLTLAEAAMLAGLPQSPVELDPYTNLEGAKERQWLVLNLMASEGFILPSQVESLYQEPLNFVQQEVSLKAPHFAVYVRQQLEETYGAEVVANGGLQVTTSLDLRYQRLAETLARQHVSTLQAEKNLNNAAMIAMKPGSGEILAMLGSVNYKDDAIDGRVNVTLSPQQPGSAIKPLTYAAGLSLDANGERQWQPGDIIWDVETEYVQTNGVTYTPVNYDNRYHGPVRLRDALANSYNVPAVLMLQQIGVPRFLEFAQQMGISSFGSDASQYGLAITLGGAELTPLELTTAYATFANAGRRPEPVSILKVEKMNGELLFEVQPVEAEQVIDPRVAYVISDILADDAARVPAMGRNNPLDLGITAAVKTGTTNDFRDNWTVGYTPGLVVGVWAGNTDNTPMVNASGLTGAAPLWQSYMEGVYSNFDLLAVLQNNGVEPATEFEPPNGGEGLEQRPLCTLASVAPGMTDCTRGASEWYLIEETTAPIPSPAPDSVVFEELDPSVIRTLAVALPPQPEEVVLALADDPDALPLLDSCFFPEGTAVESLPPDAAPQIYLEAPRNTETLKAAYEWGLANGISVLPYQSCNEELLALARDPNAPAVWRISSPKPGEAIDGIIPVLGTADFNPEQVQFYKVELGRPRGDNPNDIEWATIGDIHSEPVANGQLETLYAEGLPNGDYYLRLIVILWDGNYVGEPYTVSFKVER